MARLVVTLLISAALAGCGGGAPPQGSLDIGHARCVVAEGADTCEIGVAWTTDNAFRPMLHIDGQPIQAGPEGTRTVSIGVGSSTLTLEASGRVLARASLQAGCAVNTEADPSGRCRPTVLRYTARLFALWDDGYPRALTRTTATRLFNLTPYTDIGQCRFKPLAEANGRIDIHCAALDGTGVPPRVKLYINPLTSSLHAGDGSAPVETDYGLDDPWEAVPDNPSVKIVERVPDGYYYTWELFADAGHLWFMPDDTGIAQVIQDDREAVGACPPPRCPVLPSRVRMVRSYVN